MRRLLACLLTLVASGASAQDNMYAGLGFGEFDYQEEYTDPVLGVMVGDSVSSYKIFGGFEFNDYFAIEISYGKTDSIVSSGSGVDAIAGPYFYQLDLEYTKTALRAVGQLPIGDFVLLGGLGYFSSDGDVDEYFDVACCGQFGNEGSLSDDGMLAQLGVEWRFGRFGTRYALRLEYETWDMTSVDANTVGLAFSYGF